MKISEWNKWVQFGVRVDYDNYYFSAIPVDGLLVNEDFLWVIKTVWNADTETWSLEVIAGRMPFDIADGITITTPEGEELTA